ncbi:hypothetical protein DFH08DRAFT_825239 [Mycena albidolilacea]|uniref:Uncharacterized protein n=1 Tax=Mycena albidolilacea TaxID=1033008 RepID=A0AAD6Z2K6_9AGAR|nr:hypothetical protein DFH08DRAFT_825239 [Mycena albidolilacea]
MTETPSDRASFRAVGFDAKTRRTTRCSPKNRYALCLPAAKRDSRGWNVNDSAERSLSSVESQRERARRHGRIGGRDRGGDDERIIIAPFVSTIQTPTSAKFHSLAKYRTTTTRYTRMYLTSAATLACVVRRVGVGALEEGERALAHAMTMGQHFSKQAFLAKDRVPGPTQLLRVWQAHDREADEDHHAGFDARGAGEALVVGVDLVLLMRPNEQERESGGADVHGGCACADAHGAHPRAR